MTQSQKSYILKKLRVLLAAYRSGALGNITMPEDAHPDWEKESHEWKTIYYTLPMSLNYQRDSYKLWEAAKVTFEDIETRKCFSVKEVVKMDESNLREILLQYKLALQPNKHIDTWRRIAGTISQQWGDIRGLLSYCDNDFVKLRNTVQQEYKNGFPYLSGPKIFHYWCYILEQYCDIKFQNSDQIEIAPDTHVIQATARLGVLSENDLSNMSKTDISACWRDLLKGTGMRPIDVHSPLWFWSRNKFKFSIDV